MNVKNVEKENGSAKVTVEIAKDEFQTALDLTLMGLGTSAYYVVARLLEVHVSPHFGWLLGSTQSPDGYSVGAPPAGQADDGAPAPADAPQAQTRAERRAWEAARDGGTLSP